MVTIGPMVLLCLLGVTFYIGSKKVFAGSGKGTPSLTGSGDDNHDASDRDCTTDNSATAATNRRRGLLVTADTTAITPATTTAAVMAQRPVYPATLGRNKSSTQRIFEAGAGEEADVKQVENDHCFIRFRSGLLGLESQTPGSSVSRLRGWEKRGRSTFSGPFSVRPSVAKKPRRLV